MATFEELKTPFITQRELHPVTSTRILNLLDKTPRLSGPSKLILRAFILYTTNPNFFKVFPHLSSQESDELALLSVIGLRNLRNWRECPATYPSPWSNPFKKPEKPLHAIGRELLPMFDIKQPGPTLPEEDLSRFFSFTDACKERHQQRSVITGVEYSSAADVAHIFPHSTLQHKSPNSVLTWRFLVLFLGEQIRDILVKELHSDLHGIQTPASGILLALDTRTSYDHGFFTLVPYRRPRNNPHYVDVIYRVISTQPDVKYSSTYLDPDIDRQMTIDMNGVPTPNQIGDESKALQDGFKIRIGTNDPTLLPIPSHILLFWHGFLWDVLGAAGMSGWGNEAVLQVSGRPPGYPRDSPISSPVPKKRKSARPTGPPLSKVYQSGDGAYDRDWLDEHDLEWTYSDRSFSGADEDVTFTPLEQL
ncbi:hypothetical protein TWF696_002232 [Orbilia brochopaga]